MEEKIMKLLLHTCCAPCSVYCIDTLKEEGIEPTVYWFNPNIHHTWNINLEETA